jgi:hypothetical protein
VFAFTEGPTEVALQDIQGEQTSDTLLPTIYNYSLHFLRRNQDFQNRSGQDASLEYAYYAQDSNANTIYVGIEITSTRSLLHRWETCLVTWPISKGEQPRVSQIESTDVELHANPPIIGRYFIFEWTEGANKGLNQSVLYWYETATFKTNSSSEYKYAKISLVAYPEDLNRLPEIKSQLYEVATLIIAHWEPVTTWSMLSLLASQNGDELAIVLLVASIVLTAAHYVETRKQKQRNTDAYKKLPDMKKALVDSVHQTGKTTTPTLNNIATAYHKMTGTQLTRENLLQNMTELEKMRLVKKNTANLYDEPLTVWKANLRLK